MAGSDGAVADAEAQELLARAAAGDIVAVAALLKFEGEHAARFARPRCAEAILHARMIRATYHPNPVFALALLDDAVRLFERDRASLAGDRGVERAVAMALYNRAVKLAELQRIPEALAAYDDVVRRFGARTTPEIAEQVAKALVNKSMALGELGRRDEVEAICAQVVRMFGARPEAPLAEQVGKALVNRAFVLTKAGRSADAIAAFDEVVRRLGTRSEADVCLQVALALMNQAVILGELGQADEEMLVYQDVSWRFGQRTEAPLAEQVARALNYEGLTLARRGDFAGASEVHDDVVRKYGGRSDMTLAEAVSAALVLGRRARAGAGGAAVVPPPDAPLAKEVALALLHRGLALHEQGLAADAEPFFDEVIIHFNERGDPDVRKYVAMARVNKGVLQTSDRPEAALQTFDEVIASLDGASELPLVEQLAKALLNRAAALAKLGNAADETAAYERVAQRFGDRPEPALADIVSTAMANHAARLFQRGALEECRRAYARLIEKFEHRTDAEMAKVFVEQARKVLASLPAPS